MPKSACFPQDVIATLDSSKILGVRSGSEHRFTGVWPVVVEDRLFIRSWNDKPTGWFRAFKQEPLGAIQIAGNELQIKARTVRSARIRKAVTAAYGEKYHTKASQKWVEGFAEPGRELTTIELVPR